MSERILIADDEQVLRQNVAEYLRKAGYEVVEAENGAVALQMVREQAFDVVLADIRMPELDGVGLLERVVAERPDTHVLLVTAYASVDTAVDALRHGAYDYLIKPIALEELEQKIKNLVSLRTLQHEVRRLRRDLQETLGFEGMVGQSEAMRAVFDLVGRAAPSASTVLITGESGVGKELVARALWSRSLLADKEFLAVNMAAVPADMVEAHLFGRERGADTGDDHAHDGIFRAARGGTVFLDEIAELSLELQAKLLHTLEAGELTPLGAAKPVQASFRLIAATSQDLDALVDQGRFRQDLYFRVNVIRIAIPPLRERRADIPPLVEALAARHARASRRSRPQFSSEAMRLLLGYHWPGNVRELSNVIERATILARGDRIEPSDLPAELRSGDEAVMELRSAVAAFERRHIAWVLEVAGGNRERTAQLLGVDPATLYRRLAKYDMH